MYYTTADVLHTGGWLVGLGREVQYDTVKGGNPRLRLCFVFWGVSRWWVTVVIIIQSHPAIMDPVIVEKLLLRTNPLGVHFPHTNFPAIMNSSC